MSNVPSKDRNLPALLREAERRVNAHVFRRGGDDSLASIPANLDRDVDLLLVEAANQIELLRVALLKAVSIIQIWHNMGLSDASAMWDIYWRSSPEMKPIREALSNSGHETGSQS